MAAALKEVSLSEADDWIHVWKQARLSSDHAVGWPRESLHYRLVEAGAVIRGTKHGHIEIPPETDAEGRAVIVQAIVETMPDSVRGPFETMNIGILRGESIRHMSPKGRMKYAMLAMGIQAKRTWYDRIDMGRRHVALHLSRIFDRERSFAG